MHDRMIFGQVGQRVIELISQHADDRVDVFPDALVAGFLGHGLLDIGHMIGTHLSHPLPNLLLCLLGREFSSLESSFYLEKSLHFLCIEMGQIALHLIFHFSCFY